MQMPVDQKLTFERLSLTDAHRLHAVYEIYKESFPHPDEQEPFEAFVQILAFNCDVETQTKFGPYEEIVLAVVVPKTGQIVGGLVFGITSSPDHLKAGFAASVQAIYYFIEKEYRGRLQKSYVINQIRRYALDKFPPPEGFTAEDVAIFFEVNNPIEMTHEDILEDLDNAGLDPYLRYYLWTGIAQPLQFDYVQPSLGDGKESVHFLRLFYLGQGAQVASAMLLIHLHRFVSISVLKGRDADQDPDFMEMKAQLNKVTYVGFIPAYDPDRVRIKMIAAERRRADLNSDKVERTMAPPPMPTGPRMGSRVSPSLLNVPYQVFYRIHHLLERYHVVATWFELTVGVVAVLAAFTTFFRHSIVEAMGEDRFELSHGVADICTDLFLFFYLVSRSAVNIRRSRLGYRFKALLKRMFRNYRGMAGDDVRASEWLKSELVGRIRGRVAFGPMILPGTLEGKGAGVLAELAGYAAQLYSDRVVGVVDRNWEEWEFKQLMTWVGDFPDALIGATYQSSPDRTFFSFIVPILTSSRLSRLDMRNLNVDKRVTRILLGLSSGLRPREDTTSGPPTLMVLRLLIGDRQRDAARSSSYDTQINLLLTGLMHVALMLERLAFDGNISTGLPPNTAILIVVANRQSVQLLEWFGFALLQRSAPPEEPGAHDTPGEANLSVYRFIAGTGDRTIKQQRFLDVLTSLLQSFKYPPAPSSRAR